MAWTVIPLCAALASIGAAFWVQMYGGSDWEQALKSAERFVQVRNPLESREEFARALALARKHTGDPSAVAQVLQETGVYYFEEAQRERSTAEAAKALAFSKEALPIVLLKGTPFEKAHLLTFWIN